MGFAFGALCLLAAAPVGSNPGEDVPHWALGGTLTVNLASALVCFLKGKPRHGAFGIFIPGPALIGAVRLALPRSLWAHRFYVDAKLERSRVREGDPTPPLRTGPPPRLRRHRWRPASRPPPPPVVAPGF